MDLEETDSIDDFVLLRKIIDDSFNEGTSKLLLLSRKIEDTRAALRSSERDAGEIARDLKKLDKRRKTVSDAIMREKMIPLSDEEIAQIKKRKSQMQSQSAFLVAKNGGKTEVSGSFVIGRDSNCDMILSDLTVSRRHARIFCKNGLWRIEDLGSKNGTLVDGSRLEEGDISCLEHNSSIRLGAVEFAFEISK